MKPRTQHLRDALSRRILVLDGAMGTAIQDQNLTAADFGGPDLEGCNENLVLTRPDVIREIHEAYLEAGCDIVETNTFGGTPLVLDEYGLGRTRLRASTCAAAQHRARSGRRVLHARKAALRRRLDGPHDQSHLRHRRHHLRGASARTSTSRPRALSRAARTTSARDLPGHAQRQSRAACDRTTFRRNGRAAFPSPSPARSSRWERCSPARSVEALLRLARASGPALHRPELRHRPRVHDGPHPLARRKLSPFPVACVPNAGLPDENGCYLETPEMVARVLERFVTNGWVNLLGGCCGTHAGHIRALAELARRHEAARARTARALLRSPASTTSRSPTRCGP